MNATNDGIGRRMAAGAAWLVSLRLARRVIGVVSTIILARLLLPEDFGVVVIATSAVALFEHMSEFNLDAALIARQTTDRSFYDTAWTMNIIRGVLLAAVIAAGASPIADFFNDPRLAEVLLVMTAALAIRGFVNIKIIDFYKNLELGKNFKLNIISSLAGFIAKVSLAFWLQNYWALVIAEIFEVCVRIVLSYVLVSYRPQFSLKEWRYIINFSKWLMVSNLGEFMAGRLDRFVLAKLSDAGGLGLYAVAFEISNLPTTNLVFPIQNALFPGYRKVSHDLKALARHYLDSVSFILTLALPAGVGIALSSDGLVRVMLGENWLSATPLLNILALAGVVRVLSANARPVYLALNRPNVVMYMSFANLAVMAPMVLYGGWSNEAVGIAWAMVASAAFSAVANLGVIKFLLPIGFMHFSKAIWRPLAATAMMTIAVFLLKPLLPGIETFAEAVMRLAAIVVSGAFVYVTTILALWWLSGRPSGAEQHTLNALFDKFPGLRSKFERAH